MLERDSPCNLCTLTHVERIRIYAIRNSGSEHGRRRPRPPPSLHSASVLDSLPSHVPLHPVEPAGNCTSSCEESGAHPADAGHPCSLFPIPVRLDAPTFKKFFTACPPRDAGSADPSRMRQLVAIWTPTSPVSAPPRERRPNSGYRHLPVPPNPSVLLLTARASAFLSGGPAMVCFGPLFQGEAGRLSIVPLPSRRKGYGLLVYSFQGDKCGVQTLVRGWGTI